MNWNEYCLSQLENTKKLYKKYMKKDWDFNNPKSFTEKLWWLTIYDNSFLKTFCADKITLHDYSKEKLGKDICIPLIGIYDNAEQIDFLKLPNKFVIKCNHGSGWNIIVKDKNQLNINAIKHKLNDWLKRKWSEHEFHYHCIPPKILIEEYKENLEDIKIFCFNGIPKFCQVDKHFQEHRMNFYDCDWNYLPQISNLAYPSNPNIHDKKPEQLDEMIELAKILSNDFKFVRVDLYPNKNGIILGELTFIPGGGIIFYKDDGDLKIGKMLDL